MYDDIQHVMEKIENSNSRLYLRFIIITWIESEHTIDLVLLPDYNKIIPGIHYEPMYTIKSFPKYVGLEYVLDDSIKECRRLGTKIYYHFRNMFRLKRDLGK